MTKFGVLKK